MKLREIKQSIGALPTRELAKLDAWLRTLLSSRASTKGAQRSAKQGEVSGVRQPVHKTYQQEMVRCGKTGCKCADGQMHGPYWYAYWSEGGKVRSQYIGKRLPKGVKPQRSAKPRGVR